MGLVGDHVVGNVEDNGEVLGTNDRADVGSKDDDGELLGCTDDVGFVVDVGTPLG